MWDCGYPPHDYEFNLFPVHWAYWPRATAPAHSAIGVANGHGDSATAFVPAAKCVSAQNGESPAFGIRLDAGHEGRECEPCGRLLWCRRDTRGDLPQATRKVFPKPSADR